MTAVAFDTLIFTKKMKAAGFTEQQAEAQASAFAEIIDNNLATKTDIQLIKKDIEIIKFEIIKWLGAITVGSVSIVGTILGLLITHGH
jgi:site-specific recombinase